MGERLNLKKGSMIHILNEDGRLEPAWVLPVSLAFDHRVVDGVPVLSLLSRRPRNRKASTMKPPAVMKKTGRMPI